MPRIVGWYKGGHLLIILGAWLLVSYVQMRIKFICSMEKIPCCVASCVQLPCDFFWPRAL